MLCGLSRRLAKSFSRKDKPETTRKERAGKKRCRRRSLDDSVEMIADFSSVTIYDDDGEQVRVKDRAGLGVVVVGLRSTVNK